MRNRQSNTGAACRLGSAVARQRKPALAGWRALVWWVVVCLAWVPAQAEVKVFTPTGNGNNNWNTIGNWSPSGIPVVGDTVLITNNLSAGSASTSVLNTVDFTLTDFVATNTGAAVRQIVLNNSRTLQVTGFSWVGSNTVLNLGSNTTGGSIFSNNHLSLVENGAMVVRQSTLVVAGTFSNSANSVIAFDSAGGNRLLFTNPGNAVTNRGTLQLVLASTLGTGDNVLQVGTGAAPNTFHNAGTLIAGLGAVNFAARTFIFSNRLVNAGSLIFTNAGTGADSTLSFSMTGQTGTALTNLAGGSLRFVATGSGANVRNVATLNAGGFVNLGQLSFEHTTASRSNILTLAEAGTVFSNAVGGQVSGRGGLAFIRADRTVNLGTNLLQAGTLTYLNRTGGAGVLENAGSLRLDGGNLVVSGGITNLAGGSIRTTSGVGTLIGAVVNAGRIEANNGELVLSSGFVGTTNSGWIAPGPGGTVLVTASGGGAIVNQNTIEMGGGTLRAGLITNTNLGWIRGEGFITNMSIVNHGTIRAEGATPLHFSDTHITQVAGAVLGAEAGRLLLNTSFTNPVGATVSFLDSRGTFNAEVVNRGAWISDPSTLTFHANLFVDSSGFIQAAGDTYVFKSNFVNVSSLPATFNTLATTFVFDGGTNTLTMQSYTQQLFAAGINRGGWGSSLQSSNEWYFSNDAGTFSTNSFQFAADPVWGFTNNFALGQLVLGNAGTNTTLELRDAFGTVGADDAQVAGLYLETLTLRPGSVLIVHSNVSVYFRQTNGVTGVAFGLSSFTPGTDNVLLLGGSGFHQLVGVVPEPSVVLLWASGLWTLWAARRRQRRSANFRGREAA